MFPFTNVNMNVPQTNLMSNLIEIFNFKYNSILLQSNYLLLPDTNSKTKRFLVRKCNKLVFKINRIIYVLLVVPDGGYWWNTCCVYGNRFIMWSFLSSQRKHQCMVVVKNNLSRKFTINSDNVFVVAAVAWELLRQTWSINYNNNIQKSFHIVQH